MDAKHGEAVYKILESRTWISLELGCGPNKKHASAVGIDAMPFEGVDICGDVFDVLASFPDESVDEIHSYHFFEHIKDLDGLIHEIGRVTKINATVEVVVPHFSNPYFFSDPTHKTFFGLYTFCYFTELHPFARLVPTYGRTAPFCISGVRLNFKSSVPFYVRHVVKRALGLLFDSSNYMRELYEEWFVYLCPCYEIRYSLKRVANSRDASIALPNV